LDHTFCNLYIHIKIYCGVCVEVKTLPLRRCSVSDDGCG